MLLPVIRSSVIPSELPSCAAAPSALETLLRCVYCSHGPPPKSANHWNQLGGGTQCVAGSTNLACPESWKVMKFANPSGPSRAVATCASPLLFMRPPVAEYGLYPPPASATLDPKSPLPCVALGPLGPVPACLRPPTIPLPTACSGAALKLVAASALVLGPPP